MVEVVLILKPVNVNHFNLVHGVVNLSTDLLLELTLVEKYKFLKTIFVIQKPNLYGAVRIVKVSKFQ